MSDAPSIVRNVSDRARWVAYFCARETQGPDALLRDPFAERLAGELGFHIANTLAALPRILQRVEVDLPEIISYNEEILATEKPKCPMDRISLDLSDGPARRETLCRTEHQGEKDCGSE